MAVQTAHFFIFLFCDIGGVFRFGFAEGMRVTIACVVLSVLSHGLLGNYLLLPYSAENPVYASIVNSKSLLILGNLIAN